MSKVKGGYYITGSQAGRQFGGDRTLKQKQAAMWVRMRDWAAIVRNEIVVDPTNQLEQMQAEMRARMQEPPRREQRRTMRTAKGKNLRQWRLVTAKRLMAKVSSRTEERLAERYPREYKAYLFLKAGVGDRCRFHNFEEFMLALGPMPDGGYHVRPDDEKSGYFNLGNVHWEEGEYRTRTPDGQPTVENIAWKSMKRRCYNANSREFKYYGARGITVDSKWRNSFPAFLYDVGLKPEPKRLYSFGRKDGDANYFLENCSWETWSDQISERDARKAAKKATAMPAPAESELAVA